MNDDVEKNLLHRLQALRVGPAGSQPLSLAPQIDVIERTKTPTREDALTARLRSLRQADDSPAAAAAAAPAPESRQQTHSSGPQGIFSGGSPAAEKKRGSLPVGNVDAASWPPSTEGVAEAISDTDDDYTLQELLADVTPDEELGVQGSREPSEQEQQVRALLDKLAVATAPSDSDPDLSHRDKVRDGHVESSDDSDGEEMSCKVKDAVARCQDEEMQVEKRSSQEEDKDDEDEFQDPHDESFHESGAAADWGLPSVPSDLQHPASGPTVGRPQRPDIDEIAARIAALRAPNRNTDGGGDDDDDDDDGGGGASLTLPSVPTSRPSGKPVVKRLETMTKYTDDDVDTWCIVCFEDATLRCLGCDDDVYCTRCWREMHVGPAAAFDDRSHRAVQFTRDKKKKEAARKVALGA